MKKLRCTLTTQMERYQECEVCLKAFHEMRALLDRLIYLDPNDAAGLEAVKEEARSLTGQRSTENK